MKTNPLKQGVLTENSAGIGTVNRKMVRERAVELAVINGRSARDVSKSDWEQAKRELTGEPDTDRKRRSLNQRPNPNAGTRCRVQKAVKCQRLPVPMRTTRGEATMRDWLMKASPERSRIKCVKPARSG